MLTAGYLDVAPDAILALYHQYEDTVLQDIARRLTGLDYARPTAAWQLQRLTESGKVYDTALEELAALTGKSESTLRRMFEDAGVASMQFDDAIYRAAGLNPLPLNLSPAMARVLAAGLQKTNGIMRNLTMTTAQTAQTAFINAADLAYMQIAGGAFDYQTAIKNAIKGAAAEGLSVINFASGRRDHLDVAMRRTVLTGINQTCGKLAETRADELGADLVQTSAHIGARNTGAGPANHEGWQGQIFSRSGASREYPDFVTSTGYGTGPGLMGWNCRHSWFPYFKGISADHYQQAELESYANKRVTYNGQQMSVYEASQKQREIERYIRRWKREAGALEAAGLDNSAELGKVKRGQAKMRDFVQQTGLKRQRFREQVFGGGPLPAKPQSLDPYEEFVRSNRLSKERAAAITPADLEKGVKGDLADYMYNFWAYDSQGQPIFSSTMLESTKNDFLFNVWSLGKGQVTEVHMHPIREKAAALLSGNAQAGGKVFTLKERRLLERLASEDDDTVFAEIDSIRDKRLKGGLGSGGARTRGGKDRSLTRFRSAADEDAIEQLRENRPGWRG